MSARRAAHGARRVTRILNALPFVLGNPARLALHSALFSVAVGVVMDVRLVASTNRNKTNPAQKIGRHQ
jgi:hypothetical protein